MLDRLKGYKIRDNIRGKESDNNLIALVQIKIMRPELRQARAVGMERTDLIHVREIEITGLTN